VRTPRAARGCTHLCLGNAFQTDVWLASTFCRTSDLDHLFYDSGTRSSVLAGPVPCRGPDCVGRAHVVVTKGHLIGPLQNGCTATTRQQPLQPYISGLGFRVKGKQLSGVQALYPYYPVLGLGGKMLVSVAFFVAWNERRSGGLL